jgi:hypothetical protein
VPENQVRANRFLSFQRKVPRRVKIKYVMSSEPGTKTISPPGSDPGLGGAKLDQALERLESQIRQELPDVARIFIDIDKLAARP